MPTSFIVLKWQAVGCEVVTKWCIRLEEWSFVLPKRQLIIVTALGRQSDGLRKSLCTCPTVANDGQRRRRQKAHKKHGFTLCTRAPTLCIIPSPVKLLKSTLRPQIVGAKIDARHAAAHTARFRNPARRLQAASGLSAAWRNGSFSVSM